MNDTERQALESAIVDDPESIDPYLVYGDWLQEQGDPQGDVIALHHAVAQAPDDPLQRRKLEAAMNKHRRALLGEVADSKEVITDWWMGFIRRAWIFAPFSAHRTLAAALLARPVARFIRELRVFGDGDELARALSTLAPSKPETLDRIELVRRHTSLTSALRSKEPVRWLRAGNEEFPEKLTSLVDLEWLELGEMRRVPASLAKLTSLRRLDLVWNYNLREIADEALGIETLGYISLYDCHSLDRAYHMGRLNNLLSGFVRAGTPARRRIIELNLHLGREAKAKTLASDEDLLAALDSNVTQVRQAALRCLEQRLSKSPLVDRPITGGSEVALLGAINLDRKQLKARLEALGAKLTTKLGKATTHALLGEKPRGQQLVVDGLPLVLERHLMAAFEQSPRGTAAPTAASAEVPDTTQLAAWLAARDEASATKAIEALKPGGVPAELLAELLMVCQDVSFGNRVRKEAKKLFALHAPKPVQAAVAKHLKSSLLLDSLGETKRAERITAFCKATKGAIDPAKLARLLLARARVGMGYLFDTGDSATVNEALAVLRQGTTLELKAMELRRLPDEVGELTDLTELSAAGNHLGSIPPLVFGLTNLERLDLAGNHIRTVKPQIRDLKLLRELDLSNNAFTALPETLTELEGLEHLRFQAERYGNPDWRWSTVPESLAKLPRLRVLSLRCHRMVRVPEAVLALTRLEELDLASTELTALPEGIGALSQLKRLDLGFTRLGVLPEALSTLGELRELRLLYTQLPAEVPDWLAALTKLERLEVNRTAWAEEPAMVKLRALLPSCEIET